MPRWDTANLRRHYRKRMQENAGCFEDLFDISGRPITEEQYAAFSHQVFRDAWAEFEAQKRDARYGGYYDASAYFVDDKLVTAITNLPRTYFKTCFHEHFDRPHGVVPPSGASVGQRKLLYCERLNIAEACKMYIKVKRNKGV